MVVVVVHDTCPEPCAPDAGAEARQNPALTVRKVSSSALAAAAIVAPVVTTSSTKTARPDTLRCRTACTLDACRQRSRALAPRCSPDPIVSAFVTRASTPASHSPAAVASASSSGRSMPRRRVLRRRAGTGTTETWGPTALAISLAAHRAARAKNSSRSRLPASFQADTMPWLVPTSEAIAHTGNAGWPGTSSRGAADSERSGDSHQGASHSSHQRTSRCPQPGHCTGTTARATSRAPRTHHAG